MQSLGMPFPPDPSINRHSFDLKGGTVAMRFTTCFLTLAGVLVGPFGISPYLSNCPAAHADQGPGGLSAPTGWNTRRQNGAVIMTPPDVPQGKVFTLIVKPEISLGDETLRSWFESQITQDTKLAGTIVKDGEIVSRSDAGMLYSVKSVRTSAGPVVITAFAGIQRPGGRAQFAVILSSPSSDVYGQYTKPAMNVIMSLTNASKENDETAKSDTGNIPPHKRPVPAPANKNAEYTTRPGSGLKPSQIEGIFSASTYQMGVGGYIYPAYKPVLALKDGTWLEDVDVPPGDMDVAASKRLEPQHWFKWKRQGGEYMTQDHKGRWENAKWKFRLTGGAPGQKLSGYYSHIGGGGNTAFGGGTVIAAVHGFTFYPNGKFTSGSTASLSSADPTSDTSVVAGSTHNSDGTYHIDGYTIEFRYNDGRIDRRSFIYMDDKKDAFYLNGSTYLKE